MRPRGLGYAWCHHGEILQGVFPDRSGRRRPALVTLPMTGLRTTAEFVLGPPGGELSVAPPERTKALLAARAAMHVCARRLGFRPCGGWLRLSGPVPVGLGMGSSTSDVVAAVRAVTAAFGVALSPTTAARLAVRAETAADPLMFDTRPTLFAHRDGRVLEVLGDALPSALVLGCVLGGGGPVDTLALPVAEYLEDEYQEFQRLRALLRRAVRSADVGLLGAVCTGSARLNQRRHAKDELDELERVARRVGAAGVQVAHSGNVAGLVFDPEDPGLDRGLRRGARALNRAGVPVTMTFHIGGQLRRPTCTSTSRTRSAGRTWSVSRVDWCASGSRR